MALPVGFEALALVLWHGILLVDVGVVAGKGHEPEASQQAVGFIEVVEPQIGFGGVVARGGRYFSVWVM